MSNTDVVPMSDAEREEHVARTEQAMREAGVPTEEQITEDYFAFEVEHKVFLPDGKQYILHRELNEGQRKKYLNSVNRDVTISRVTQDMKMKMSPGDERHALLEAAIVDWYLIRDGHPVAYSTRTLKEFLEKAPPRIIDLIEKEVRKANPWLLAEMSLEDIDKEMANLQEMRDAKAKEEAGKDSLRAR